MKRVLLVAFQYPPMAGSSGIQRALRFSQYLPRFGWEPIVLTVNPRAYEMTSDDQMSQIPGSVHVERAFALDAARHLSIGGRYMKAMARPDRWSSWHWWGVRAGMRLIRDFKPAAIWSTFPIPTAHRIGMNLHRRSGLPWIADFRDVMTEEGYPADRRLARSWGRLESEIIEACSVAVFTTPGAARMYADRYPRKASDRFLLIENGYDEEVFSGVEAMPKCAVEQRSSRMIRLVHSGVVYPSERDPTHLFAAMRTLKDSGAIGSENFRLLLRASGHDSHIAALASAAGVSDLIELGAPIPYREALQEMMAADGLVVLQAENCNRQIPAKIYEYLRAGRPVLGLASGDTAGALRAAGIDTVARLESTDEIMRLVVRFLDLLRSGHAPIARAESIHGHSRLAKSQELATILDATTS